ncbi:acyltransferase family protein [Pseudopedobacter beijingensis]|uniref:Acyltransferase family protein n=1 Tax=Pseudopedobacter beijingensis TaxID=1207056 RepID=A0ABW4I8J1_9SPHI
MINQTSRNYTLDILRAFAAFIVVVFHLNEPIPHIDNWYRNIVKLGWLGVPIFFVISGYCIMMSAFKTSNSKEFILKRFFRIFPPYWASLIIVLLAAVLQKIITGYNSVNFIPTNLQEILANISLLTKPFSKIETINWVYWSLTYEWFFYMVIGIVLLLPYRFWMLALSMFTLISIFIPISDSGFFFFFNHWPTFSLGLAVYAFHFLKGKERLSYFFALAVLSIYGLVTNFALKGQLEYAYVSIFTFVLIVVSPYISISQNIFTRLGDYSYAVYLLHVPIGIYLFGKLKTPFIQENIGWNILYDLLNYSLCCIISYFFFRYIELPSMKMGKRFSKSNLKTQITIS